MWYFVDLSSSNSIFLWNCTTKQTFFDMTQFAEYVVMFILGWSLKPKNAIHLSISKIAEDTYKWVMHQFLQFVVFYIWVKKRKENERDWIIVESTVQNVLITILSHNCLRYDVKFTNKSFWIIDEKVIHNIKMLWWWIHSHKTRVIPLKISICSGGVQ